MTLGPHLKRIEKWIEDDKKQPRKQRHTARRILTDWKMNMVIKEVKKQSGVM